MKMLLLFLTVWSAGHHSGHTDPDIATLRTLFYAAENSKNAWLKLVETLKLADHNAKPIYICYNGVSEMMGAKYTLSPVTKFSRFKKGKMLIQSAVTKAPDDLEIRFLRFSVQTNLPSFLGYNDHINEDKQILLNKVNQLADKTLKNNILKYLSSSKHCTNEEKQILMK